MPSGKEYVAILPAFPIEESYVYSEELSSFIATRWDIPYAVAIAYVIVIFGGQFLMKGRQGFTLQKPLLVWNIFLSVLSIAMAIRIVPVLIHYLRNEGFHASLCDVGGFAHGPVGFWVLVFTLSKIPEMIDTVFLVLRKRQVIFLHWYHHITVMLYSWHCQYSFAGIGLWCQAMNAFVHSIMYPYYALAAAGRRPTWGWVLTLIQIAQMIMGIVVQLYSFYIVVVRDDECSTYCTAPNCKEWQPEAYKRNLIMGTLMYISYFILFAKLYLQKNTGKSRSSASGAGKTSTSKKPKRA